MNKFLISIVLIFLFSSSLFASDEIISPDKKYKVVVEPFLFNKSSAEENYIKIYGSNNKVIAEKDFRSKTKKHGYIIQQIQWTPDSKFLIFSGYSSGGHQPWNSPTYFFSTSNQKFYSLDSIIGPVLDAEFEINSASRIKIFYKEKNTYKEKNELIDLNSIMNR